MSDRILVAFSGDGAGVGELTWGQEHIWQGMAATGRSLSMSAIRALDEGATIEQFVDELRFYMSRFQAMRTRLRFEPDGRTLQVVAGSGEVPLEIVDAGDEADPAQVADGLARRYDDVPFDYANEWPVRMGVVRQRGVLTHMVMTLSHHIADGTAAMVMFLDHVNRDPVTGEAKGPVTAMQPLELARSQQMPSAQRHSGAALRQWETLLRTVPSRRFREVVEAPTQRRYWQLAYESPAMFLALQALGHRTRADASSLLLAVYAVALARVTGMNPVVAQLLVGNRFRPGFAEIVAPMTQSGLCVIDVAGTTFEEAVARARRRAMTAHKYAYYDRLKMDELIATIGRERGEQIDLGCIFNDRRQPATLELTGPVPTESDVRAALPRSRIRWEKQLDLFNEQLMMNFNEAPDAVAVEVTVDTHHLPPADLEAFLNELEAVAVEAASRPFAPTNVKPTAVGV